MAHDVMDSRAVSTQYFPGFRDIHKFDAPDPSCVIPARCMPVPPPPGNSAGLATKIVLAQVAPVFREGGTTFITVYLYRATLNLNYIRANIFTFKHI